MVVPNGVRAGVELPSWCDEDAGDEAECPMCRETIDLRQYRAALRIGLRLPLHQCGPVLENGKSAYRYGTYA